MANIGRGIRQTAAGLSPLITQLVLAKKQREREEKRRTEDRDIEAQKRRELAKQQFLGRQYENLEPENKATALSEFGLKPGPVLAENIIGERLAKTAAGMGDVNLSPEEQAIAKQYLSEEARRKQQADILAQYGLGGAQVAGLAKSGAMQIPGVQTAPDVVARTQAAKTLADVRGATLEKEKLNRELVQKRIEKVDADIRKVYSDINKDRAKGGKKDTPRKLNELIDNMRASIATEKSLLELEDDERVIAQKVQEIKDKALELRKLEKSSAILNGTLIAKPENGQPAIETIVRWVEEGYILPQEFEAVVKLNDLDDEVK